MRRGRRIGSLLVAIFAIFAVRRPGRDARRRSSARWCSIGDIDPVTARFVVGQINAANNAGDAAVLLRIDTPGGLDTSMREIDAGRAGVEGAGDHLRRAGRRPRRPPPACSWCRPPTWPRWRRRRTSARRRRSGSGRTCRAGDLKNKIVNDAAARIRALATTHGRNADWAEQAVREAANATAAEALQLHVIEIIATDTQDLLRQANGRTTTPKGITLDARRARRWRRTRCRCTCRSSTS